MKLVLMRLMSEVDEDDQEKLLASVFTEGVLEGALDLLRNKGPESPTYFNIVDLDEEVFELVARETKKHENFNDALRRLLLLK